MTELLILLCLLTLANLVASCLALFQRTEDNHEQTRLQHDVRELLEYLERQRLEAQEIADQVGRTWLPTEQDQHRVEALLTKQGRTRAHARTGSDPFTHSAKLAP